MQRTGAILLLVWMALFPVSIAKAQISRIGQFTCEPSEGFETHTSGSHPTPLDVFSGQCTVDDAGDWVTLSGAWGSESGIVYPRSGARFMGGDEPIEWVFHMPAEQFGGYFTILELDGTSEDAFATFLDADGHVLGQVDVKAPHNGDWTWNGWRSNEPFSVVRITGKGVKAATVMHDDMEYELWGPRRCGDGIDNDNDGFIDHPDDPGCDNPFDDSEATPATPTVPLPLAKDQQICVNEMTKNGERVNKAQLKENERCLREFQNGNLASLTYEACFHADRGGKVQRAKAKTVEGELKKCGPLKEPPFFAYTDAATVNFAAVAGAWDLPHEIFGHMLGDAGLVAKASSKDAARCQLEMLKQTNKLEHAVLKEMNKERRKVLAAGADSASALETALAAVFALNERPTRAEYRLVRAVDKKCSSLLAFDAIFPGPCADPDLDGVEACAIAAARCQACLRINMFTGLGLNCDEADDRCGNLSCP